MVYNQNKATPDRVFLAPSRELTKKELDANVAIPAGHPGLACYKGCAFTLTDTRRLSTLWVAREVCVMNMPTNTACAATKEKITGVVKQEQNPVVEPHHKSGCTDPEMLAILAEHRAGIQRIIESNKEIIKRNEAVLARTHADVLFTKSGLRDMWDTIYAEMSEGWPYNLILLAIPIVYFIVLIFLFQSGIVQ